MCTHKLSMIGLGVDWHVHWPLGPPKVGSASIHSSTSLRHWQALLRIEMKSAEQESHSRPIADAHVHLQNDPKDPMKDCSSGAPLSYNGVSNPLAKEYGNDVTRDSPSRRYDNWR